VLRLMNHTDVVTAEASDSDHCHAGFGEGGGQDIEASTAANYPYRINKNRR